MKSLIRNIGAWCVFCYDLGVALVSWVIVHTLILERLHVFLLEQFIFIIIAFTLSIKVFRTYASLWKSVSVDDLKRSVYAVILGASLFFAFEFIANRLIYVARSEIIFYPALTLLLMLSGRFFYRQYLLNIRKSTGKKLAIIGAGAGANLFLRENEISQSYQVVIIFDDNSALHGKLLRNKSIAGPIRLLKKPGFLNKYAIDEFLIAIPSLNTKDLQRIYTEVSQLHLPVKVMPSLLDLTHGAKVTDLREVSIEELLGRDQVFIHSAQLQQIYNNKVVLVTGGAGSIGAEIIRQLLAKSTPRHIIVLDHSEFNLYEIERELSPKKYTTQLRFILGSVLDRALLETCFAQHIDIVFHSAAYKHVPLLETQPKIAIENNIIGTQNLVDLSAKYNIERFLLVSSDKAVNPTNVMGATKRIAELYVNSQQNTKISDTETIKKTNKTKFMVTRFGNVLGSTGSVIPLFKEQLKNGGPITVTDKAIERYFMTIQEASLLVALSGAIGQDGETFVLEMGKPVKIIQLAEQLITLSGKRPYVDIAIEFTGLRPGEKMYEELFYSKENLKSSGYQKLMTSSSACLTSIEISNILTEIKQHPTKEKLLEIVGKYKECGSRNLD